MTDFTVTFKVNVSYYKTTIPAKTSGEAQEKFVQFYEKAFKIRNNLNLPAKIVSISEVSRGKQKRFDFEKELERVYGKLFGIFNQKKV
jgi:hypothetical protein